MTLKPAIRGTVTRPDQGLPGLSSFWGRAPFWSLRDEMDNLLSPFSGDGGMVAGFNAMLDMSETDDAIEVKMDIPGIQPEEIEVEVIGNTLQITGERKEEQEEKGKTFHRIERTSGSFSRSVKLPCEVQSEHIEAECAEGVLTVKLPKSDFRKPHKVTVKTKS
ncbi:Hsp20/alpha crystallin family protein [Gimesia fumaroli]|uniref:Spore protein SP21 n=1 Tax=Gimesia fumaroli TaxID=2527976 RepID=A0A518I971_9PLAN|nr:Hsp20/alpha crystallin family protein [Gimesia fumaroli]QDV49640.1 Spore protein SP21 [Gimesia fumaroli]